MQDKERLDLLLLGGSVVTVDDNGTVFDPGAVGILGERIVKVGPKEQLVGYPALRTVRCDGKAVLPGFVDCHNHLFQGIVRGLGEGIDLEAWLSEFLWPLVMNITSAEARAAVTNGAVEAASAGITSVLDNHYPTDFDTTMTIADAIEEVGLRGVVARGMFGDESTITPRSPISGDALRYSMEAELDITREAMQARQGRRVGVWPSPANMIYNSQELVRRAVELARDLGTGWHTHCSQARTDPVSYEESYGIRPVDWLYEQGLLGQDATIAHGIYLSDQEIERMGETASAVAYCPVSHQYIALGVMRLRELRRAGAVVGLGTDGPCANHRQDMFELMKSGILLQRVHTEDPLASNAEEALKMATREGAQFLGVDAGVLTAGKLADVIVVNMRAPHLVPLHRLLGTLVYAARGSDVEMTIVGGKVVYEGGHCANVDEGSVMDEVQGRAKELVKRAGLEALCREWRDPDEEGLGVTS